MNIYGAPTCTYEQFERHLTHSPAAAEAAGLWVLFRHYNIDPAVALGFFHHESACGTQGRAVETKSWGNIRWRPLYANLPYPVEDHDGFCLYLSYTEGAHHFCDHLAGYDGTSNYVGLTTVEQVVPVWAPAPTNNPPRYIEAVNDFATTLGGLSVALPKVLLCGGHIGIASITADRIGQASADALRSGTGARGEVEWNGWFVGMERDALKATGLVDARAIGATYDAATYAEWKPDLIVWSHFQRDADAERAIFSSPDPGVFLGRVDLSESERFRDRLIGGYEAVTGIPVTQGFENPNTTRFYGYWYAEPESAVVLAEWGNANVDTVALYDAARAQAILTYVRDCIIEHFNLAAPVEPPPTRREDDAVPDLQPTITALREVAAGLRTAAARLEALAGPA